MRRVIFAHGMESSPSGTKAAYLREALGALTPDLSAFELDAQIALLCNLLRASDPAVLVGSSLGGLAALGAAAARPSGVSHLVLLAPAVGVHLRPDTLASSRGARPGLEDAVRALSAAVIPEQVPATLIHGFEDDVVAVSDVVALAARSRSARLILVHADHRLSTERELILTVVSQAASFDPVI